MSDLPSIDALLEDTPAPASEQTLRDAAFNTDRQWFKSRPDRSFRARPATEQEIEDLHTSRA